MSSPTGLDSDESYEGVSEASFKDALVFDGSSQKNNGSVPQENGIKKHRYCCIPAACMFAAALCVCPQTPTETSGMCWAWPKLLRIRVECVIVIGPLNDTSAFFKNIFVHRFSSCFHWHLFQHCSSRVSGKTSEFWQEILLNTRNFIPRLHQVMKCCVIYNAVDVEYDYVKDT